MQVPVNLTPEEIRRVFNLLGEIVLGHQVQRAIGTSETTVAHGLGRVPKGWLLFSPQSGAASPVETSPPDNFNLYLSASSAVTPKLWVW